MSDRFPGLIDIGGEIKTPEQFHSMASAIASQGVSHDWGDADVDVSDVVEMVFDPDRDNAPLKLMDDQARSGEFEELEETLRELGIPYQRHSDTKYEYDGELAWWQPGMKKAGVVNATQDGEPTVTLKELKEAMQMDGRSITETLHAVEQLIKEKSPPRLPPLTVLFTKEQYEEYVQSL